MHFYFLSNFIYENNNEDLYHELNNSGNPNLYHYFYSLINGAFNFRNMTTLTFDIWKKFSDKSQKAGDENFPNISDGLRLTAFNLLESTTDNN